MNLKQSCEPTTLKDAVKALRVRSKHFATKAKSERRYRQKCESATAARVYLTAANMVAKVIQRKAVSSGN